RRVRRHLAAGPAFWAGRKGQALLAAFDGGPAATALADWLGAALPTLFGGGPGGPGPAGGGHPAVAARFPPPRPPPPRPPARRRGAGGRRLGAEVLAAALSVYATTLPLRGPAGRKFGLAVSATGLGARWLRVGRRGAAFGVANHTRLNVYQLLQAVDQQAVAGVPYGGNPVLQREADNLFRALNRIASIGG